MPGNLASVSGLIQGWRWRPPLFRGGTQGTLWGHSVFLIFSLRRTINHMLRLWSIGLPVDDFRFRWNGIR